MYKLSLTYTAHVRPLFEMCPLMTPQTLHPGEPFVANITAVGFLPSMDVLMTPQVPQVFKAEATAVADVGLFTRVNSFVDFEVLFLSESFATAATFVRSFTCVYVIVYFEVGYVGEDSATDLTLIELLLTLKSSFALGPFLSLLILIVYMLTVTLLMYHVVPVGLEAFTTHLAFERFVIPSMTHPVYSQ